MSMRTHELHPALTHAPLTLLPAAALVDLLAAGARWDRRLVLDRLGRRLWWATAAGGLVTGLTGMAASQEIEVPNDRARDVMFLHGFGNLAVVVAAFGVATWRATHRASYASAVSGLLATAAATYTGYLGGELVYGYGGGVKALGGAAAEAPALFSREAPARLARDAFRGLRWLVSRGGRTLARRQRMDGAALRGAEQAGTATSP
jgi:uncharacterized membrane protein